MNSISSETFCEFFAVGLFSFVGVFIRIKLSETVGNHVNPSGAFEEIFSTQSFLLSNIVGCFLMAIFVSNKNLLTTWSPSFFVGLSTGLCGSLTTLSTWMVQAFNSQFDNKNTGYLILRLVVEFSLTWTALIVGFGCVHLVRDILSTGERATNENQFEQVSFEVANIRSVDQFNEEVVDSEHCEDSNAAAELKVDWEIIVWCGLFSISFVSILVALIVLATKRDGGSNDNGEYGSSESINRLKSIVLAPAGAWLRWSLGKVTLLRESIPSLHFHTLIANLVAVCVASSLTEFGHQQEQIGSSWSSNIVAGFCGSLSTVSTFFVELHKTYSSKGGALLAVRYLLVTLVLAIGIVQIVLKIKQQ